MEFIKDKYALLVKCDSEEIALKIKRAIGTLLNKSSYEDELGLYDVEGNILQFWTIKNYFTIATEGNEIDFLEETIKKLLARFGLTESKSEDGNSVNEATSVTKSKEVLAQEVLDVMRERHPSIIHGAGSGRDGDDIYLSFTLENPNFELEDEEIERYNDEVALKWAGIVHDDDRWILEVSLDKLAAEEGQDAGPLVMAIAEEAANACQWLDEKYCEGTRSWGAPIDRS